MQSEEEKQIKQKVMELSEISNYDLDFCSEFVRKNKNLNTNELIEMLYQWKIIKWKIIK